MEAIWTPSGSQLSQEMLTLAQELNDKYPNLSLAWIPPENRGEGDERPFAIVQIDSEGNQVAIIHRMHSLEVHPSYVFNWLWENDTRRVDVWDRYMTTLKAEHEAKRKQEKEDNYELAEYVNAVAKSPLHTYRMAGHKIGAENNYPTLGMNDLAD